MKQNLFTKNFTLLVLGQVSSLFGNYILKLALSMYVLEKTGSAAIFAGILAFAMIPTILLSPLGGILADRVNRKKIMVVLDFLSGIVVLCSALLFTENSSITVISILLVLLSVLGAFESPTVQACVPQMQTGDNIIKGNAVVTQVAAVAGLVAPILGSVFYVAFGLRLVMYAAIVCFFLTAFIECFIKLENIQINNGEKLLLTGKNKDGVYCYINNESLMGVGSIIKNDFKISMQFICKDQPNILKMLLLTALVSFFVVGTALVGLPYMVRTVLGLNAEYYGAAESVLGFAAILGSVAAGMLIGKLPIQKLSLAIAALGVFLIPAGTVFLFPVSAVFRYAVILISFCGAQVAACIFSVFALSYIQQKTPDHLMGKVMAYVAAISMCAQPLGQTVYGLLFDRFRNEIYLILIPSGLLVLVSGIFMTGFFKKLEHGNQPEPVKITGIS